MIPAGCVAACPGCKHREFSAGESTQQKMDWAKANLEKFGAVSPILAPASRWHYRQKATLHARFLEGRWQFGLLRRRRNEEIFVPIPNCPVQAPDLNRLVAACAMLPAELPLAFVQISGRAITLILKSARKEPLLSLVKQSSEKLGGESVFINWNAAAGRRVISSRHMELIYGPRFLLANGFHHGPTAFRQQIPEMEDQAHALAGKHLERSEKILDLYCGIGTTLALWRRRGQAALGVELAGEACELAGLNAPGTEILKGKLEDRLPQLAQLTGFDIYTNPPREGHGARMGEWINASGAKRIAYLACNMRSLREDLERWTNYRADLIQPFDFFPQTDHVEALVLLSRAK